MLKSVRLVKYVFKGYLCGFQDSSYSLISKMLKPCLLKPACERASMRETETNPIKGGNLHPETPSHVAMLSPWAKHGEGGWEAGWVPLLLPINTKQNPSLDKARGLSRTHPGAEDVCSPHCLPRSPPDTRTRHGDLQEGLISNKPSS